MNAKNKTKKSKNSAAKNPKSGMITSGIALGLTLIIGALVYTFMVLRNPIAVNNSLAYMSELKVATIMQPAVAESLENKSFTIVVDGKESQFRLGDYGFTSAVESDGYSETVKYTDSEGKNQTKTITTKGSICFDETAVRRFINNLAKEYGTPMIEPYYEIDGDVLTIYKGTDGMGIDFDTLMSVIEERIRNSDYSPITAQVKTLTAPEVNIDNIYTSVKCDPVNAFATEDSAGGVTFTEEVVGKDFDLEKARQTVSKDADSWKIKLTLTQPEIDLTEARAPYCLDELSSCTTGYSGSSKARANNVEKAADNINTYGDFTDGYILQPGEVFSFNTAVGERTEANGFMKAPVYVSSGSQDDYGGGICQVSTTLYCAALYANLEITERHNHLYVIHYWPTEGADATVDWGRLDLKIKNNKEYPIKIKCTYTKKRRLTVSITGTEDGITAKLESKIIETTAYNTVYKNPTSENPEGKVSGGDNGYLIRVWRLVYKDGKFVSKKVESYNQYKPLDKVIYTANPPTEETEKSTE